MTATSRPAGPPLFVAVNAGCNLTCWYCTEHGENRNFGGGRLSLARLTQILEVAYERGIRVFRFTGGEPTLRQNLGAILLTAQALGDDVRIAVTTNGERLAGLINVFEELNEPRIFLSVDGLDKRLAQLGGDTPTFRIEKWLTPELMGVVDELKHCASVRLNYVLTQASAPQLPALIEYASGQAIDIKVFELLLRDFFYTGHRPRAEVFAEQYVSVREIVPVLTSTYGEPTSFVGTGGRGIPMHAFHTGTSRIVYFDSAEGSHYSDVCHKCSHYPCQEGLYALLLDANGVLHPAGCVNQSLHTHLGIASHGQLVHAFDRLQGVIDSSTLEPVLSNLLAEAHAF